MKNKMLRSFSLLGITMMMALSVAAQEPKLKASDKETKYKSEDLKVKAKNNEEKYKAATVKVKEDKDKRKIKGRVTPMHRTMIEASGLKTGETQVQTKEEIAPVTVETTTPEPLVQQAPIPEVAVPEPRLPAPKRVAAKHVYHKPVAARKSAPRKYIVRTKVVRDTVFIPSPPEQVVKTETQYLHDTVTVTRVDTFEKVQTENTYTGYAVPRGNFKKVKLRRDKHTGDVEMKRKEKDGKVKDELK